MFAKEESSCSNTTNIAVPDFSQGTWRKLCFSRPKNPPQESSKPPAEICESTTHVTQPDCVAKKWERLRPDFENSWRLLYARPNHRNWKVERVVTGYLCEDDFRDPKRTNWVTEIPTHEPIDPLVKEGAVAEVAQSTASDAPTKCLMRTSPRISQKRRAWRKRSLKAKRLRTSVEADVEVVMRRMVNLVVKEVGPKGDLVSIRELSGLALSEPGLLAERTEIHDLVRKQPLSNGIVRSLRHRVVEREKEGEESDMCMEMFSENVVCGGSDKDNIWENWGDEVSIESDLMEGEWPRNVFAQFPVLKNWIQTCEAKLAEQQWEIPFPTITSVYSLSTVHETPQMVEKEIRKLMNSLLIRVCFQIKRDKKQQAKLARITARRQGLKGRQVQDLSPQDPVPDHRSTSLDRILALADPGFLGVESNLPPGRPQSLDLASAFASKCLDEFLETGDLSLENSYVGRSFDTPSSDHGESIIDLLERNLEMNSMNYESDTDSGVALSPVSVPSPEDTCSLVILSPTLAQEAVQAIRMMPGAVEPRQNAVEPRQNAVEPRQKAVEPRQKAVEPRQKAVEPRQNTLPMRMDLKKRLSKMKPNARVKIRKKRPLEFNGFNVRYKVGSLGSISSRKVAFNRPRSPAKRILIEVPQLSSSGGCSKPGVVRKSEEMARKLPKPLPGRSLSPPNLPEIQSEILNEDWAAKFFLQRACGVDLKKEMSVGEIVHEAVNKIRHMQNMHKSLSDQAQQCLRNQLCILWKIEQLRDVVEKATEDEVIIVDDD